MVLAAGLGTRLRPITDTDAEAAGRDRRPHAARPCDRPAGAGRRRARRRQRALQGGDDRRPSRRAATIRASSSRDEAELLETGGGVARALPLLGEAFFVVNSDVLWLDGRDDALAAPRRRLRSRGAWTPCCCCSAPRRAVGYDGSGDYFLDALGTAAPPRRARGRAVSVRRHPAAAPPRCSTASPSGVFSLVRLYDRAEAAGRLHAIVHDGEWYHVGTPEGLAATRARLSSHRIER